jgi:hypothetical protein
MKSKSKFLRIAKKLGLLILGIILLFAIAGINEGYKEAHNKQKIETIAP